MGRCVLTQKRCRCAISGQTGSSSATCITNMWIMHFTGAVCCLSGFPMYLNFPSMGTCRAQRYSLQQ